MIQIYKLLKNFVTFLNKKKPMGMFIGSSKFDYENNNYM